MPQSLAQIYIHLVFSTKNREPTLYEELQPKLHTYLAGISNTLGAQAITVGGVEDHIHLLGRLPRTLTVASWVEKLKVGSNRWFKEKAEAKGREAFSWQSGYGAFSISPRHVDPLVAYIRNQKEHHRDVTFQEEYRHFMKKYGLELDERYAWD